MNDDKEHLYRQLLTAEVETEEPRDDLLQKTIAASATALPKDWADIPAEIAHAAWPMAPEPSARRSLDSPPCGRATRDTGRARSVSGGRPAWRRPTLRYGLAASLAACIVFGGLVLWPDGWRARRASSWWLGPRAAWAGEIRSALDRVAERAFTCRELVFLVTADGQWLGGDTVVTYYQNADSYRRDLYDNGELREVQWYVPNEQGMLQTGYRLDQGTQDALQHDGAFRPVDPIVALRGLVERVTREGECLGTRVIEDRTCVGFRIGSDGHDVLAQRVWFDAERRLPVRHEIDFRPGQDVRQLPVAIASQTMVRDQYDYAPNLPPDTFTPRIPPGLRPMDEGDR